VKILIPLAGHSRRFQAAGFAEPKAFLRVGDRTMIEQVVGMFGSEDEFVFIVNEDQAREFPQAVASLTDLAVNTQTIVIPSHEKGPVYSCLQVQGLADDEPVIVNYCDFKMDWDYERFLKDCEGTDGCLAVFRGFHPASLGSTFFAYLQCLGNRLVRLREKQSFTDDRMQELASTGTYYFGHWGTFKKYAESLVVQSGEAYASLLYNPMVADGLKVHVSEVRKFICLGTPEDVAQYNLWWNCFRSNQPQASDSITSDINLVLMAGEGERFRTLGYSQRKPFIPVDNKPMIQRAVESLPRAQNQLALTRRDTESAATLVYDALFDDVIELDSLTQGPAETCLYAKDRIAPTASVLVTSCDYSVRVDLARWQRAVKRTEVDVFIWTTNLRGRIVRSFSDYAYCKLVVGTQQVEQVQEKQVISPDPAGDALVTGTFWFRRASNLFTAIEKNRAANLRVNGEFYVGTSINQLIAAGLRVEIFEVDQWVSFGTPVELQTYEFWKGHFECSNLSATA
jgi:NDP-sugar pyrophosphorylase family protein